MTIQINIRIDEHLLEEIDALSHMLHVPRSEWLRMRLAEVVKDNILKYRETLSLEYSIDHISYEELHTLIGKDAEKVKSIQEMAKKGTKEIEKKELLKMQVHSNAYQDWLSAENDIYDEVFNDESA